MSRGNAIADSTASAPRPSNVRFRIVPLDASLADEARRTSRSPRYGHPVHREVAAGYGPCRVCLRPFEKGVDRRLLFTYDAFHAHEPLPLPGPVFVHEDACPPFEDRGRFPEQLTFIPLTLNAYARGRHLREAVRLDSYEDVDAAIVRLLGRDDVDYVHARNSEAGCLICRIERAARIDTGRSLDAP